MKTFDRIFALITIPIILIFVVANVLVINSDNSGGRPYRVEANRIAQLIEDGTFDKSELSEYKYITAVVKQSDAPDRFYQSNSDYQIIEINGELYRFDYISKADNGKTVLLLNIALGIMALLVIGVMLYIRIRILTPFNKLTDVPYELSKGNLTAPVKENKNRFFGRFIWGIDLLRENIEEQKGKELELQKEKKTLLLSLSHDIKTPLSAIKLYSKALSKGLYTDKEKQLEIAESINGKADEIESYISQIIKASNEDFLHLETIEAEFYLDELITNIAAYYSEKLGLIHTQFVIAPHGNCLIAGDKERSIEVIQNIIENAIKYGDGNKIEMLFSEEENCQLVTIRNTGNAPDDNEITHIFDSFYRGSNSAAKNGSGLGLYICRQLMIKMKGDIFAKAGDGFMELTCVFRKA